MSEYLTHYCYVNRSKVPQFVTSSQFLRNITINQLRGAGANIISVFRDKLLISSGDFELSIYTYDGLFLSNITISGSNSLLDATWTPYGNIVYATDSTEVMVISESGQIIATHNQLTQPQLFSVSIDDIIYLADLQKGVYQSTDDGISWNLIVNSTDGWNFLQAIKVTADRFLTLERMDDIYRIQVYDRDKKRSDNNFTRRNVNVTSTNYIDLAHSRLSYDGNVNIFLNDISNKAVHVFLANGSFYRQLLPPRYINNPPWGLAINIENQILFVGQDDGVSMFKLIYEERAN